MSASKEYTLLQKGQKNRCPRRPGALFEKTAPGPRKNFYLARKLAPGEFSRDFLTSKSFYISTHPAGKIKPVYRLAWGVIDSILNTWKKNLMLPGLAIPGFIIWRYPGLSFAYLFMPIVFGPLFVVYIRSRFPGNFFT